MYLTPLLIAELGSAGFFGLGLLVLYGAVVQRRKKSLMEDIPTSKVRSLAVGPVEVKGEPVVRDEPLESPFTDTQSVMYTYSVEAYHEGGKNSSNGWNTVEAGVKAPPFYVDDGTGRVLVDPDGSEKEFSAGNEWEFDEGDETENVLEFMERRDEVFGESESMDASSVLSTMAEFATATDMRVGDAEGLVGSDRRRRYKERYLPVDADEVYVFGRAMRDDAESSENEENLVISRGSETPLFKISDKPEEEVVSETGESQLAGMAFGFLFTVGGFGATLYTAGALYGVALLGLAGYGAYRFNERFSMQKSPDEGFGG
jgi:hypothetical protein